VTRTDAAAKRVRSQVSRARFIVLTGLSGSGKSQAIRALEDLGYFCVDNLPITLIPTLARLTLRAGTEISRAAVVVDVREGGLLAQFPSVFRKLRAIRGLDPVLIFLEASDAALVRRFSETRRPHPLAADRSVIEGIKDERARLAPIRDMAHVVVDTSDMTVHELRHAFLALSRGEKGQARLVLTLLSFGYKHGLPLDADLVFDVRFLPNPHFVARLRRYNGKDAPVRDFLGQYPQTGEFLERATDLLRFLVPQYVSEGKSYLTVAIGCTGGKHRSVAVAEAMRRALAGQPDVRLRVRHRDIANE
jgi:UPF0042 nucleotide-binding protein